MFSPVRPGWHSMFGYGSLQHSAVVSHVWLGSVQVVFSPPKQRRKPAPVGMHPVSPPPLGQQFELAP
jgi:hypothetical protein